MKKIILISVILMIITGCGSTGKTENNIVKTSSHLEVKNEKAVLTEKKVFKRNTSFTLDIQGAKEVYLIGDMTEWEKNKIKFIKTGKESWALNTMIEPGKYEYKYLIDGNAVIDEL